MLKLLIICCIIAVFIVYGLYVYKQCNQFKYVDTYKFSSQPGAITTIPKVIIQTYYNKSKIPNKVYENIKKYAPEYKHIIYDDNECIKFLTQFDNRYKKISDLSCVDKFKSFKKGAHKADLFRYCYLYQYGGIYLDIKTELIQPLNTIFNNFENSLYTVLARNKYTIYQGIIASYPEHPILGDLINQCIGSNNRILGTYYSLFLKFFYMTLEDNIKSSGSITPGTYQTYGLGTVYLLQEEDCPIVDCDTTDRYNSCTFIQDKYGNKIIKTRYSDFPW
jgi:hypothetical protein